LPPGRRSQGGPPRVTGRAVSFFAPSVAEARDPALHKAQIAAYVVQVRVLDRPRSRETARRGCTGGPFSFSTPRAIKGPRQFITKTWSLARWHAL